MLAPDDSKTTEKEEQPPPSATPVVTSAENIFSAFGEISDRAALHFNWLLEQYASLPGALAATCLPDGSSVDSRRPPVVNAGLNPLVGLEARDLLVTAGEIGKLSVQKPVVMLEQASGLVQELTMILSGMSKRAATAGDKRFSHRMWQENPVFKRQMQGYLAWCESVHRFVEKGEKDPARREHMRFVASLMTAALAPSNTLVGNPAALEEAARSNGMSVIAGLLNRIEDLVSNRGMPSLMNKHVFAVGKNLAVTPGAVVHRTPVLELIQYSPATDRVYTCPQILVPPLISKGYVMDLAPGRSMVEHLVGRGQQVFAISWRNPTAEERHWGIDEYVDALFAATRAACSITDSPQANIHGICGGTRVMAPFLGYLAAKRHPLVNAASLIVANLTADDNGVGLFADEAAIASVKRKSAARGVLDGEDIKHAYTLARSQELVWKYWVNNYLMGNPPPANDILYWSCDTPRMPARLHHELLDIFAGNLFAKPAAVRVLGTPIDLMAIACDKFVVAGMTDHISPWGTAFATAKLFGGQFRFCANSSGHAQTIVSPPGNSALSYLVNEQPAQTAEQWLAGAKTQTGSWWDYWALWLAEKSGALRPAPTRLGNEEHPPRAAAPGEYVIEP